MYRDKKGDRVGGRKAGITVGGEPECSCLQKKVTQGIEHHREAKVRVWDEVTRFDV